MEKVHVYLISDCTGDTLRSVSSAVMDRFSDIKYFEHVFPLVRTTQQVDKIIEQVLIQPGVVMYTLVDEDLRNYLKIQCLQNKIKYIPVLSHIISKMSEYLGLRTNTIVGKRFEFDEDYNARINAVNFAIAHDDGQNIEDLEDADIILVGVSRTSKSPTSIYLAYRGLKTANIPFIEDSHQLEILKTLTKPLVVGLLINYDILVHIRKNRMLSINNTEVSEYLLPENVKEEIENSKRFFLNNNIPYLDVSRRSVEETAARIIQMYKEKHS